MLKQIDGKWALVSQKTQRPLAYYKGEGKPSAEWVKKQESRIQYFKESSDVKNIEEAAYVGNIGIMELVKFYQKATPQMIEKVKKLIAQKKNKQAWKIIQDTTGVKLIGKQFHEERQPSAGAGEEGTTKLRHTYQKDTPGQGLKTFKKFVKNR